MATAHQQRQAIWKKLDRRLVQDQVAISQAIGLMMLRDATATNQDGDRAIPPTRIAIRRLSKRIWSEVLKPYYIGLGDDPLDELQPQSPYSERLISSIKEAILFEAKEQVKVTRKLLKRKAPDILKFLTTGEEPPLPLSEMHFNLVPGPAFTPADFRDIDGKIDPDKAKKAFVKPRGTYDPSHLFVDPGGYRLSDRIWRSGLGERTAIDRYLEYHIPRGTSAVEMAKTLEVFLTGKAAKVGTKKPYGTNGSYSARRLARTEVTAAAGRSAIAMSEANPYVMGLRWMLSGSHPERDPCDINAGGGEESNGVYPPSEVPRYPDHPHCLCTLAPVPAGNVDAIVVGMRKKLTQHKKAVFEEGTKGLGATGEDIQAFKALLDPTKLATSAFNGTLQQTIADAIGKTVKPLSAKQAAIAKAAADKKKAFDEKVAKMQKEQDAATAKADALIAQIKAEQKAAEEAEKKAKAAAKKAAAEAAAKEAAKKAAQKALEDEAKAKELAKAATDIPKVLKKIQGYEEKILQLEEDIEFFKKRGSLKKLASKRASRSRFRKLIKQQRELLPEGFEGDTRPFGSLLDELLPDDEKAPEKAAVSSTTHYKDGFPKDLKRLELVKELGGSTGAQLVRDPVDGKQYVRKRGGDAGHIREEMATDKAYQAMGVNVPSARLYDTGDRPTKLAVFIEGDSLQNVRRNDARRYMKARIALQEDFAADALLGNWDVIGMDFDNVIVQADGTVWRIDNGGGLRRRAQGQMKNELEFNWESKDRYGDWQTNKERFQWNQYVDDLWSMRDQNRNSQLFEVFGDMDYFDIEPQIRRIAKQKKKITAAMPEGMLSLMGDRIKILEDIADISETFRKDDWVASYTDQFTKHSIGFRKREMISKLPKELTRRGVEVRDENGKTWDDLRVDRYNSSPGQRSSVHDMEEYMRNNGGDQGFVNFWADQQKGDSWLNGPQGVKYFYASQRGQMPEDKFWWKQGADYAKGLYDNNLQQLGADKYQQTFTQLHAFNYEFMRNVKFPKSNQKKQTVRLMRTESADVMDRQNFALKESGVMKRGAVESTSIYEEVYVHGTELTVMKEVPFHRILGNYFLERKPGLGEGMFLGDGENEFVAMLDGLTTDYTKTKRYRY